MTQGMHSMQWERKRKFLLALPVIVAPFLIFVVWVLGLVGPAGAAPAGQANAGLNIHLPNALPAGDSTWDKLRFYEQADKDSARLRKLRQQDPYFNKRRTVQQLLGDSGQVGAADAQEQAVYEKVSAIHRAMERPEARPKPVVRPPVRPAVEPGADIEGSSVARLERMMEHMQSRDAQEDPGMRQIRELMESIKDIQHPERVSERSKEAMPARKVYPIELEGSANVSTRLESNRFFSLADAAVHGSTPVAIEAVVAEEQRVQPGGVVRFRLTQPVFVQGVELVEHTLVYGVAKLESGRMQVQIPGVTVGGAILPVSLAVYAADGLEGIPLQDGALQKAMHQTTDRSLQGITGRAMGMNLAGQVAGAALQAGKTLLKKQHTTISVVVPAGYPVRLINQMNH